LAPSSCDRNRPPPSQVACKLTLFAPPFTQLSQPFQLPRTPTAQRLTTTTLGLFRSCYAEQFLTCWHCVYLHVIGWQFHKTISSAHESQYAGSGGRGGGVVIETVPQAITTIPNTHESALWEVGILPNDVYVECREPASKSPRNIQRRYEWNTANSLVLVPSVECFWQCSGPAGDRTEAN
jgi:hypothetical protein